MSELLDAFAANLSKLCQAEGGTARVSQAMKMPRQQLNRYLAGGTQPTDRNVERICNFFGVTPPDLFRKPVEDAERAPDDSTRWSHGHVRATLKRLHSEPPAGLKPGLYFAHFAFEPGSVMRSTVIIRRDGNLATFRRLTGRSEAKGSYWSRFSGDHQGFILERRSNFYFCALNTLATEEPTVMVLRWVPDIDPLLAGTATILTPDGPSVTPVVLTACPPRTTLRRALRASHVYDIDQPEIHLAVLDALNQQVELLAASVRRFDSKGVQGARQTRLVPGSLPRSKPGGSDLMTGIGGQR